MAEPIRTVDDVLALLKERAVEHRTKSKDAFRVGNTQDANYHLDSFVEFLEIIAEVTRRRAVSDGEERDDAQKQLASVAAERDQLRVMAGLLEQFFSGVSLPNGRRVYRDREWERVLEKTVWRISNCTELYPTAIAAIMAGMGWDEPGSA